LTLLKRPEPWGSAKMILIFLFYFLRYCDTPARVPPVPAEQTKVFISPLVCLYISGPVVNA
jgi:hypothetical protein